MTSWQSASLYPDEALCQRARKHRVNPSSCIVWRLQLLGGGGGWIAVCRIKA